MADSPFQEIAALLREAAKTLSRGIKTRNVGRCRTCGGSTSSGMDPICYGCALGALNAAASTLDRYAEVLGQLERAVMPDIRMEQTIYRPCEPRFSKALAELLTLSSPLTETTDT